MNIERNPEQTLKTIKTEKKSEQDLNGNAVKVYYFWFYPIWRQLGINSTVIQASVYDSG